MERGAGDGADGRRGQDGDGGDGCDGGVDGDVRRDRCAGGGVVVLSKQAGEGLSE